MRMMNISKRRKIYHIGFINFFLFLAFTWFVVPYTIAADELGSVYAFPVPFKPEVHGISGITFTNIPISGTIQIFSPPGELLRTINIDNLPIAAISWDFKDTNGRLLPDGVYYCVVKSTTSASTTFFIFKESGCPGTIFAPAFPPGEIVVNKYDEYGYKIGTCLLTIKDTETGSISLIGGAKGFVNPVTGDKLSIGFKPTGSGSIKIKIFDGKGKLVRMFTTEANGMQSGSIQWDGRDSSGRIVPSGIYLIHVKGPGIDTTKKTVILK